MGTIDRTKTCPFLVRIFFQRDGHHTQEEFEKEFPSPELNLYTWMDASLSEISSIVVRTAKLGAVSSLSFATVSPNMIEGGWDIKPIKTFDMNDREEEPIVLQDIGFMPGYMIDVAYASV